MTETKFTPGLDTPPACPSCSERLRAVCASSVELWWLCDACGWQEGDDSPAFGLREFASEGDLFSSANAVVVLAHLQPSKSVTGTPWRFKAEFADGGWRMRCDDSAGFVGYVANTRTRSAPIAPEEELVF